MGGQHTPLHNEWSLHSEQTLRRERSLQNERPLYVASVRRIISGRYTIVSGRFVK